MSITIHLREELLIEYQESIWINNRLTQFISAVGSGYNTNIYEASVLSNEKDVLSGNVTITFQYATVKKDIEKSINTIDHRYCNYRAFKWIWILFPIPSILYKQCWYYSIS